MYRKLDSNLSRNFAIGFSLIGLGLIGLIIFFCCRKRSWFKKIKRRSSTDSIESFQQLYFTKTSFDQIKEFDQRIIERWSAIDQPSLTFYR